MQARYKGVAVLCLALLASPAGAQPASSPGHPAASGSMPQMMEHMGAMHGPAAGTMMHQPMLDADAPTEPGQAAFGAIQEIVAMLQADPHTDWSKVDIDALRQHLVDMDEVTMRASAHKEPVDNGLRIEVTGTGRTLEAIQRMVPEHARDIDGMNGWTVRTAPMANGIVLTVTASNPTDVQEIRALGFMGIMVQGSHHQPHHLAMAKGEPMHMHHQPNR